jgi:TRAP-type C4-dicarboxylate transport system substrate-binding protein
MGLFHGIGLKSVASYAVGAIALAGIAGSAQAVELTYSYWAPDRGSVPDTMKWWAGQLAERTGGDLTVNIGWGQSLSRFRDNFNAVSSGEVDVAELAASFSLSEIGAWGVADTGQGSSDPYVATRALENLRSQFAVFDEQIAAAGLKYLWHYSWGGVALLGTGDTPITNPNQFNGENVRMASFLAAAIRDNGWNANPVSGVSIGEMRQGMERGTVNGGSNYLAGIGTQGFAAVTDWVTILDQGQHTGLVVMNLETWNALSADAQNAIDGLRNEMIERLTRGEIEQDVAVRASLEGEGITVVDASPEEAAIWGAAMQGAFVKRANDVSPSFPDAVSFLDAYQAEIARVAAEVAANGHPWE